MESVLIKDNLEFVGALCHDLFCMGKLYGMRL